MTAVGLIYFYPQFNSYSGEILIKPNAFLTENLNPDHRKHSHLNTSYVQSQNLVLKEERDNSSAHDCFIQYTKS